MEGSETVDRLTGDCQHSAEKVLEKDAWFGHSGSISIRRPARMMWPPIHHGSHARVLTITMRANEWIRWEAASPRKMKWREKDSLLFPQWWWDELKGARGRAAACMHAKCCATTSPLANSIVSWLPRDSSRGRDKRVSPGRASEHGMDGCVTVVFVVGRSADRIGKRIEGA
jgi:hypothetical protein